MSYPSAKEHRRQPARDGCIVRHMEPGTVRELDAFAPHSRMAGAGGKHQILQVCENIVCRTKTTEPFQSTGSTHIARIACTSVAEKSSGRGVTLRNKAPLHRQVLVSGLRAGKRLRKRGLLSFKGGTTKAPGLPGPLCYPWHDGREAVYWITRSNGMRACIPNCFLASLARLN